MSQKKRAIVSLSVTFISIILIIMVNIWKTNLPLVSPIDLIESLPPVNNLLHRRSNKIVYGFLPYWNIKMSNSLRIRELTHLAYFGLDLNSDGTLKKFDNPKELEPGYSKASSSQIQLLKRQLKILNKKFILVIRGMDNDLIESIINDPLSTQTAVSQIVKFMSDNQFDGINLDFEYIGSPDNKTKNNFTNFVSDLSAACKISLPTCEMSIDILADTGYKNRIHDLEAIDKYVNQIIIMAYDFYRPSSLQAGPVAPLRGKCGSVKYTGSETCLEYDVITSVSDISKIISPSKLILGVPFYGYEWQVTTPNYLSNAIPKTGAIASYKRIQNLILDPPDPSTFVLSWSNSSQSPFITYQENNLLYQIYYENTLSLKLKLDLINQSSLSGVAIWALGYETPYDDLWETISRFL